jgi:hypothetical protein
VDADQKAALQADARGLGHHAITDTPAASKLQGFLAQGIDQSPGDDPFCILAKGYQ